MAIQTTTTPTAYLSPKVQAIYDRMLLRRVVEDQTTDMYGTTRQIPRKSNTKQAFCYRYKNLLPATTVLAEFNGSNRIVSNKIVREEIGYDVKHYGDYVEINDEINLYDFRNIESDFIDILGDQASLTAETLRRDILSAGTNVIYADGATDRASVASGAKKIIKNDIRLATVGFKNQGAKKFNKVITGSTKVATKPIRSAFVLLAHPSVVEDLRDINGWTNVENYADYSKALKDEVGALGDFRVIEYNLAKVIDQDGKNVYVTLAIAKDAYATISLRGHKKIQVIVKPIGSAGSADPLSQQGSFAWKMIFGCKILNEAFIKRFESTASIEDNTQKHFYDYS